MNSRVLATMFIISIGLLCLKKSVERKPPWERLRIGKSKVCACSGIEFYEFMYFNDVMFRCR